MRKTIAATTLAMMIALGAHAGVGPVKTSKAGTVAKPRIYSWIVVKGPINCNGPWKDATFIGTFRTRKAAAEECGKIGTACIAIAPLTRPVTPAAAK